MSTFHAKVFSVTPGMWPINATSVAVDAELREKIRDMFPPVPAPIQKEFGNRLYGMKIICDPDMPPNTAEMRAADGTVLQRIKFTN